MSGTFDVSFEYKVIYIFSINDRTHAGLLKIGDASLQTATAIDALAPNNRELNQAARERIDSYTATAGIAYKLEYTELAVRTVLQDGVPQIKAFRDHDVHNVLKNSGIQRKVFDDAKGREWFEVDLATAKKAIEAVKQCRPHLTQNEITEKHSPIVFRPEQDAAINRTLRQFKTGNNMLWNAKMRFGKTLCALEVVKRSGFAKTIIATHRPVVNDGWYKDFGNIFFDAPDVIYGSKSNGDNVEDLLANGKKFVYFASIQDLRGSSTVGGKFDKNDLVFTTEWDCVIVDEAHEGTTTALGEDVIKALVKDGSGHPAKFLALSGTPFNILGNYNDDAIYTWDYVMEQTQKAEWDKNHFGDSNPYEELPELSIYTYDLGKLLKDSRYVELEDKAFNFREFFRTWTGRYQQDHAVMPENAHVGDFVHENDVRSFLGLLTKPDEDSHYPYANEEFRRLFQHSLWMVPGVREAKALSKLLKAHPIFGNGTFEIVNVAGDGDEEERPEEALSKVRRAIADAGDDGYTITLSCGKLTTGVTIPEWTAVFMLAGSFSTSAANYLQTIFRVQSPCNRNGKIKNRCYVFDFAPDRTLKMVAEAAAISTKAGKTSTDDRVILGDFLNYCPVIAIDGTQMRKYDTNNLLQQLKRAYAERAVQNGFDDNYLYDAQALLTLEGLDIEEFNKLKGIIGSTKAAPKAREIDINQQGFTNEEYEELGRIEKKPKRERTPEEERALEEAKKKNKLKQDAISILRGISIRMPLLIYGADVPIDEDVTLDKLVRLVDDASWNEFMPKGVDKRMFRKFMRYYDPEVFVAAGRRIRATVMSADRMLPAERVRKIADLMLCFKNPDKETVLTPWRVVNMHMSDTLGGYDFYDEKHDHPLSPEVSPRFVDQGDVTRQTLANPDARILEINSKTGLYPLYVTYSIFHSKCAAMRPDELDDAVQERIWNETVQDNVFVICKTPMAKAITKRTLVGFKDVPVNTRYFDDLINTLQNKQKQFVDKVLKASYWKKAGEKMRFDAVVGNPPYQGMTNGGIDNGKAAKQARPVFHQFVLQGKSLSPKYISMIIPARWYNGGMSLDEFREAMLNDRHLVKLVDYYNAKECFPTVEIAGGLCYFLWDVNTESDCEVINVIADKRNTVIRPLNQFGLTFIRSNAAISIINKVRAKHSRFMDEMVSPLDTFGIPSKEKGHKEYREGDLVLITSSGYNAQTTSYIERSKIKKNTDLIDKYKVKISIMIPQSGEVGINPEAGYRSISTPQVLLPGQVDSFSYLNVGFLDTEEQANNLRDYLFCKFPRFMLRTTYSSVHVSKANFVFVPLMDFTKHWSDEKLYKLFDLSDDEVALIEKTMRPMV